MQPADDSYALGHSSRELKRLGRQAEIFGDMTRQIMTRAGISPGMRVLDLGSGAGDVSFIISELVGPTGSVHGIDISPAAVGAATARAAAGGLKNVTFETANMAAFPGYGEFDAVTGRFLLMHVPDAGPVLAGIARAMRKGALLAFAEFDLDTVTASRELALFRTCVDMIIGVYKRAGFEPNMGSKLYDAYRAAGLAPDLAAFTRVGAGDAAGVEFLVESVRSLLPAMEKVGVATAAAIGIDTLGERLTAEAAAADACVFYPRLVGAWART